MFDTIIMRFAILAICAIFRIGQCADNTACLNQLQVVARNCDFRDFFRKVDDCEQRTQQLEHQVATVLSSRHTWTINNLQKEIDYLSVRLNGDSEYNGRAEVYYKGHWGAICSEGWDRQDADVFCRMIGFNKSSTTVKTGSTSLPYVLNNMHCNGDESSIYDCQHTQISPGDASPCTANTAALVTCDIGVRLVEGSDQYRGRVEVSHRGQWGTICDEGWGSNDAAVICKMLGLPTQHAKAVHGSLYGAGQGLILLSNVSCSGSEASILDCSHSPFGRSPYYCNHQSDAGVYCDPNI